MKFGVIGLGRFGYHVATTLAENNMEVLGVDRNESIVFSIRDQITQAICADLSDEASLRSIGMDEMDTVIVAMGENVSESVLITVLLKKKLNIPLIITRAINQIHKEILLLIGADRVILPEQEVAEKLANDLSLPFSVLTRLSKEFSIGQITSPSTFVGKSIEELNHFKKYHVSCIGIMKDEKISPLSDDYKIEENDTLIFAGNNKDLAALARL